MSNKLATRPAGAGPRGLTLVEYIELRFILNTATGPIVSSLVPSLWARFGRKSNRIQQAASSLSLVDGLIVDSKEKLVVPEELWNSWSVTEPFSIALLMALLVT